MRSKVAVIRTQPKNVLGDIETIMNNAGITDALPKNTATILKDNISWHVPFLSANTTPWQLEGTILALKNNGYSDIVTVHNDTVVTNPFKGGKLNRLTPLYKKYNIEERFNFIPSDIKWIEYKPKAKMNALYDVYPEGIYIPEYFIGKNIIHLPTVKTHIYTTTTGAMKNAFGGLLGTKRHYNHSTIHKTLVDLLAIQKEIHPGVFTVMDGTICGCGPGPRTMTPVVKNYMLASSDSVAIDAVAAKMMGFDPMSICYIRMAHEQGLGCADTSQIDIVGEDISNVNFHFHVGNNFASRFGNTCWFGSLKPLQKLFFHTPLVYAFVFASYLYHDYIWWPYVGKKMQKDIRTLTGWGKLFNSY